MTTTQAPGLTDVRGEAPAGPGINSPGAGMPGERATPAPAADAPARPSESQVGLPARPAGDSFQLPKRTRQPRFEPGCNCAMCRPRWTG